MKSKISIRQWVIIVLFLLTCIPFLGTKFASHIYNQYFSPPQDIIQNDEKNVQEWIEKNILTKPDLWGETEWRNKIKQDLIDRGIEIIILDSNNQPAFMNINIASSRAVHEKKDYSINLSKAAFEQQAVYRNGELVGIAFIRHSPPDEIGAPSESQGLFIKEWGGVIVWLSLFFLVLLVCTVITNRVILRPLKLLEQAALLLSRKQFTAVLPASPVKEINEVSKGFKFMQQELQKLLASQVQMEEDRKMFIASIVHDLRTPLFSIRGYLEGLEQGVASTPEKQKKYIEICKNKADLLEELVSNLFQYVKLDYLGTQPKFQNIELEGLVKNIMEGYALEFSKKNIALSLEVSGTPLVLKGNYFLLIRAIDNIISNALRHTPNNGSVDITLKKSVDEITITIKDSGDGISEDILPHIFKPLYRGEYSRNRKTGGAGLGLTIAKHIFVLHGGDLIAKNDSESGAIFIGYIPIRQI